MVVRTTLLLMLVSTLAFGQKQKDRTEPSGDQIIRKGLFRAQATLSPGWTIADGNTNFYVQGDMEFYLQRHISLKGDFSYFLDTQGKGYLKHNHGVSFGAQYHFPIKRFDPYIGLHPGVGFIQVTNPNVGTPEIGVYPTESVLKVAPVISVSTGFNFYVWKYLHFMTNIKYVHATHPTEWGTTYALDEFRVSFGLGWNVNMIRRK